MLAASHRGHRHLRRVDRAVVFQYCARNFLDPTPQYGQFGSALLLVVIVLVGRTACIGGALVAQLVIRKPAASRRRIPEGTRNGTICAGKPGNGEPSAGFASRATVAPIGAGRRHALIGPNGAGKNT